MNRRTCAVLAALALLSAGAKAQQVDFDGRSADAASVRNMLQGTGDAPAVPASAAASPAAASCSVEVVDTMNKTVGHFTVASRPQGPGAALYSVSDGRSTEEAVVRGEDAAIEAGGGVPHPTPIQIRSDYKDGAETLSKSSRFATPNHQLIYTVKPGSSCTSFDSALLMFWINEWFYFG